MFIPRVNSEVIVSFVNGNPDCPIIIGYYNVVEIIDEKEDWIYILYITKDYKVIKAWIPKNALENKN